MSEFVLRGERLSHAYKASDGQQVIAIENVSLGLLPGTFTCLVGASGCGKTTLLRILAGLLKPSDGKIYFRDSPLTKPTRQISMVFQNDNLMPWRSVQRNVALPLQLAGVGGKSRQKRVKTMLDITGLTGFEHVFPAELSGGMAQRVAIARGLVSEPDIFLLDEPFGALDALTREKMWRELLNIWATTQTTVLMVTHSIREAVFLADRVLVMSPRPGKILAGFEINFPRPREFGLLGEAAFTEKEMEIRQLLG